MTAAQLIEAAGLCHRYDTLMDGIASGRRTVSEEETALRKIDAIGNPLYRLLLVRRGIYADPWDQLAEELHYSKRQMYRVYNAALAQLQYVLDSDPTE